MTTISEFLSGEPLDYRGFDRRKRLRVTYQIGVGAIITDRDGSEIGFVEAVRDDEAARRIYHVLKRNS